MNKLMTGIATARVRNASKQAAIAAVGFATLSLFAVQANAASEIFSPSKRVDFQDLDLSSDKDAKRLYQRLRLAASEVCVGYPDTRVLNRNTARGRCQHNAIEAAIEAIGHPNLSALHAEKSETKVAQSKAKPASNS